jgi:hypothetical protein
MARIRPVLGSMATTEPDLLPRREYASVCSFGLMDVSIDAPRFWLPEISDLNLFHHRLSDWPLSSSFLDASTPRSARAVIE